MKNLGQVSTKYLKEKKEELEILLVTSGRILCSCIKCGFRKLAPKGKHCKDIKCPKCGGEMRRVERPGPGRDYNLGGNMEPKVCHVKTARDISKDEPGSPISFRLTERMVDRDSEVIEPKGVQMTDYKKNPVVLWSHNRTTGEMRPPIGKILIDTIEQTNEYIDADIILDVENDTFAMMIDGKIRNGFLNTGSIGFRPLTIGREPVLPLQKGATIVKSELFEFSIVNIPANVGASRREWEEFIDECNSFDCMTEKIDKGEFFESYREYFDNDTEEKAAVPYKKFPLAEEGAPWSFTAADGNRILGDPPNWDRYRSVHCWYDSANPEKRASYKLPVAKVSGGGIKVFWRAVHAAMGALLGARGGVQLPVADRKGVYNRLKRYYSDFSKTPPDFKECEDTEIKFVDIEEKVGAVLSAANRQTVQNALNSIDSLSESLTKVKSSLKTLLDSTQKPPKKTEEYFDSTSYISTLREIQEQVRKIGGEISTSNIEEIRQTAKLLNELI